MRKILLVTLLVIAGSPALLAPVSFTQNERIDQCKFMLLKEMRQKQFELFIEHLGLKESNDQWWVINRLNCIGKWQFSEPTLALLGYKNITARKFSKDLTIFPEELQKKVLLSLFQYNEIKLSDYMSFIGTTINDVLITKSGLLAAAHLGGAMSVRLYLNSGGKINKHDINNTSIRDYIKEFSGYDIE